MRTLREEKTDKYERYKNSIYNARDANITRPRSCSCFTAVKESRAMNYTWLWLLADGVGCTATGVPHQSNGRCHLEEQKRSTNFTRRPDLVTC